MYKTIKIGDIADLSHKITKAEMWFFKTVTSGTLLWKYTYLTDSEDWTFSAKQQLDRSVIIFGSGYDEDLLIVKIS